MRFDFRQFINGNRLEARISNRTRQYLLQVAGLSDDLMMKDPALNF